MSLTGYSLVSKYSLLIPSTMWGSSATEDPAYASSSYMGYESSKCLLVCLKFFYFFRARWEWLGPQYLSALGPEYLSAPFLLKWRMHAFLPWLLPLHLTPPKVIPLCLGAPGFLYQSAPGSWRTGTPLSLPSYRLHEGHQTVTPRPGAFKLCIDRKTGVRKLSWIVDVHKN